jgi:hypothetical protein
VIFCVCNFYISPTPTRHTCTYIFKLHICPFFVYKDSVARFLCPVSVKHFLLVPFNTLRNNFDFNTITDIFYFKSDSSVYSPLGSLQFLVYSPLGSFALQGVLTTHVFITWESQILLPDVFTTRESRLPSVFTTRESRPQCIQYQGVYKNVHSRVAGSHI